MAGSAGSTGTIPVLNSQGTKIYVGPLPATPWTDCDAAVTAIKGTSFKTVGCPQSIGKISQTRDETEYKCMSSNQSAKALGAIKRGSLEIGMLLDPKDTEGQKALKDAFRANDHVIVALELPDVGSKNGTIFWMQAAVSGLDIGIETDAAITCTATLAISSDINECAAA